MSFSLMSSIVSFRSVTLAIQDRLLLQDVSFDVGKGEFVYLVGRTGVGKSSLLKLLYADLQADTGAIMTTGYQVHSIGKSEIPFLRRKLGIVFQDYQLLPDRNVYQNLHFALRATGWKKTNDIKRRINEVLIQVGMTGKAASMPHQLSGGEQQRIAIGRALLNEPLLMIADEPTGNLDPDTSNYIMELFQKIHLSGTAILFATHEYQLIKKNPARVLEIRSGKMVDYPEADMFLSQFGARLR